MDLLRFDFIDPRDQRELDRAKAPRRKGKPRGAALCAFASLRENRFPRLLKDPDETHLTEPDLLRFYFIEAIVQRELDRAKTPRRKENPREAVLCAFASLREKGFPWLLEDSDETQITEPELLRFYFTEAIVPRELDRAKAPRRKGNQEGLFFAPSRLCARTLGTAPNREAYIRLGSMNDAGNRAVTQKHDTKH